MARFSVGSFAHTSAVTTVAHGAEPTTDNIGIIGLAGSTGAADTTLAGRAQIGLGFGEAGKVASLLGVAGSYSGFFQGSSAQVGGNSTLGPHWLLESSARTYQSYTASSHYSSGNLSVTGATTSPTTPLGVAVVTGNDVNKVPFRAAISTVATTQAVEFGVPNFTPNAAIIVGQSFVSSVANLSIGFACVDTAGNRSQWSISQMGRESNNAHVHRSASTASAVKLHTTATTAHDVSVTSFRSSGLELTVNATDPARAATISILGLDVPKANAGKATITTNGVGAGQTGVNVTGLGQNVGLVILASIASSLQTLQEDNRWSVGFASSNGNQRSVASHANNGAGSAGGYMSYFNSTRAVTFTDTAGVISVGLFAVTTDGFSVTMDNTAANGWDLYWAALSNTVTDLSASIQSSGGVQADLDEVTRLAAAIVSSGDIAGNLLRQFDPTRGTLAADAKIETRTDDGESLTYGLIENSTSPDRTDYLDVTTEHKSLGVSKYQNAKHLWIIPPSTNTVPMRLAGSLQSSGVPISSRGQQSIALSEDAGQELYLFTTLTSGSVPGVRYVLR